jgi:hypothetical protein
MQLVARVKLILTEGAIFVAIYSLKNGQAIRLLCRVVRWCKWVQLNEEFMRRFVILFEGYRTTDCNT